MELLLTKINRISILLVEKLKLEQHQLPIQEIDVLLPILFPGGVIIGTIAVLKNVYY